MFRDRRPIASPSKSVSVSGPSNEPEVSDDFMEKEEPTLEKRVELVFRELDLGDHVEVRDRKDEDSDDDEEALDSSKTRADSRQHDQDSGTDRNWDGNNEDDEANLDEDEDDSLVGMEDAIVSGGNHTKSTGEGTGIFSKIIHFGVSLKKEINKRKTRTGTKRLTIRAKLRNKDIPELKTIRCIQRMVAHDGPVWTVEFAPAPHPYMASAGRSGEICVWEFDNNPLLSQVSRSESLSASTSPSKGATTANEADASSDEAENVAGVLITGLPLLRKEPIRRFAGHAGDVTSLAWSKSLFLASGGVDKTCRIWHMSSTSCLCVLRHPDFVTSVDFHPLDDSVVMTGCFDKNLRFWDVASGLVAKRMPCASRVTACRFNQTGEIAAAGLYIGHIVLFQMGPFGYDKPVTSGVRYYTQIETRNKIGVEKKGRKVTAIRFVNVNQKLSSFASREQEHMLVTTNESKARLYNMDDFSLVRRYKGASNSSMLQIGASVSSDARHIICGSEDRHVVVWRLQNDLVKARLIRQSKRDMCETYESFTASSVGPVTVACFAPDHFLRLRGKTKSPATHSPKHSTSAGGEDQGQVSDDEFEARGRDNANSDNSPREMQDNFNLPTEDPVGLSGAMIITCGIDGIIGIFESI